MVAAADIRCVRAIVIILMLMKPGNLHTAHIPVIGVYVFIVQVASDGIGNPGLHALDQILTIDRSVHPVLPEGDKRDHAHPASILIASDHGRVGARRHRALEEPPGREKDFEPPQLSGGRLRSRLSLRVQGPSVVAADEIGDPLFGQEREPAAATLAGIVALYPDVFLSRGHRLEIDRHGITRQVHSRPILIRRDILPDHALPAGARVVDGLHVGRAHRGRGGLQDAAYILRRG